MKRNGNFICVISAMIAMMSLASCASTETSDNSVNQESISTESSTTDNDAKENSGTDIPSENAIESKDTGKTETNDDLKTDEVDYPLIEDIDWSVDELIDDGERTVMMSVTNNSNYKIQCFNLSFFEKKNLTEEQVNSVYNYMMKYLDDDEVESIEDIKKLVDGISMWSETDSVLAPGETESHIDLYYFKGYHSMKSFEHYQLVEPDIAEIEYMDGNTQKTVYYDFHSQKYTKNEEVITLNTWTSSELGELIPKIDNKLIEDEYDLGDSLMFEVLDISPDEYNDYIQKCKDMGYTEDIMEFDGYYDASNANGNSIGLGYNKNQKSLSITIRKSAD